MQKKGKNENQLAQLCSQTVSLIFWVWGLKNTDFAENTIKIVVSAYYEIWKKGQKCQKVWVKTWSRVASKLGPSILRKISGENAIFLKKVVPTAEFR